MGAPGNTGQADQAAALIRGLQQTEVRRQEEGLVHVQGRDQLPRQQVAAGIAGDDQAEQSLVVKALLTEQRGQPVHTGGQIRRERVVVIGAEHHERIAAAHRRIDLLDHRTAVEAAALLAEVQAGGVAAPVAVRDASVAQTDLLDLDRLGQSLTHQLPEGKRVGGAALRGVQGEHMADRGRLLPAVQPLDQLGHRSAERSPLVHTADLRLHAEIAHGAGRLHQRTPQKGAARLIGREHHIARDVLGVKLSDAGHDDARHTAREQAAVPPELGKHPIIGFVAAALVERNGEKQTAVSQTGHPILGVDKAASIRKDCLQHCAQRRAVFIFRQKNGQCHDTPSLSVDRAQLSFRFPQPRHQRVRQSKAFQLRAGGCCPVARSHKDAAEIGRRAMPFPAQA